MTAFEGFAVLMVSVASVLVAFGLAASALRLLLTRFRVRDWRTAAE